MYQICLTILPNMSSLELKHYDLCPTPSITNLNLEIFTCVCFTITTYLSLFGRVEKKPNL